MTDLLSWLEAVPFYPKLYWYNPLRDKAIAAAGHGEAPSAKRVFSWRPFCAKKSPEWEGFCEKRVLAPRMERTSPGKGVSAGKTQPLERPRTIASLPSREAWEKTVLAFLADIRENHYEKAVAARRVALRFDREINPVSVWRALAAVAEGTLFFLQLAPHIAFLGATPEWLYRRDGRRIFADALAGTRAAAMENELLRSAKELRECGIVKARLLEALTPFCESPPTATPLSVKRAGPVAHLYTRIEGVLRAGVDDAELLNALHPTAALGGWPKEAALAAIRKWEPFARGLYGAPLGWQSEREALFAVGIRSCLIRGSAMYLYAGAGIVEGSDPQAEWEETQQKMGLWDTLLP